MRSGMECRISSRGPSEKKTQHLTSPWRAHTWIHDDGHTIWSSSSLSWHWWSSVNPQVHICLVWRLWVEESEKFRRQYSFCGAYTYLCGNCADFSGCFTNFHGAYTHSRNSSKVGISSGFGCTWRALGDATLTFDNKLMMNQQYWFCRWSSPSVWLLVVVIRDENIVRR